ncbi:MAG: ribonuclease III family protein, partial [Alphaproteobacteria bacterium]
TELVRRETLAEIAVSLDLGPMIRMSKGEKDGGGQQKESLLADVVEALIAAMYLDGGLSPVRTFLEKNWSPYLEAAKRPPRDPKTALQEWAQARALPLPVYDLVGQTGPSHEPQFEISVSVEGQKPVSATAGSKRAAEREAAAVLLERVMAASGSEE